MVRPKEGARRRGKVGLIALVSAWVLLAAVVGGGLAWVFYLHPEAQQAESPEIAEPAVPEASAPEVQAPEVQAPEVQAPEAPVREAATAEAPSPPKPAAVTPEAPPVVPAETAAAEQPAATAEDLSAKLRKPSGEEALPAWRRYAEAFDIRDTQPRIAVVITGLGLNEKATGLAIRKLPPAFTLSFTPYADDLERWIALARVEGHEVMLDLPMEPIDFPQSDPGPLALMTQAGNKQNLERLNEILGRGSSYVGVAGILGSRFAGSAPDMKTLLRALKTKGLIYLDNGSAPENLGVELAASLEVALVQNDRFLDTSQANAEAVLARLAQVESIALTRGQALAMASPYPLSIEQLAVWANSLKEKGLTLAPVTALLRRPGPA